MTRATSFFSPLVWCTLVLAIGVAGGACTSEGEHGEQEGEEAELARYMTDLQRWTHKTTLATEAQNGPLADFYLHEMEETVETIQTEAATYEGHAVAELTDQMFVPQMEALTRAVEKRAWSTVNTRVQELAQACNQCRAKTDHGFIRVDLSDVPNPYSQDFSRSP